MLEGLVGGLVLIGGVEDELDTGGLGVFVVMLPTVEELTAGVGAKELATVAVVFSTVAVLAVIVGSAAISGQSGSTLNKNGLTESPDGSCISKGSSSSDDVESKI